MCKFRMQIDTAFPQDILNNNNNNNNNLCESSYILCAIFNR